MTARPATKGRQMSSRWAAVRFRQSPSTKRMASASVAATPTSMAWALEPASGGSRWTTLAPAAAARSPVPSVDPSSTTITWRVWEQPWQASTTSAIVSASLRAGTTTSITMTLRSRAASAGPLAAGHDLDGDLAGGLVDHLVAEHDRTLPLALGGLPVGVQDVPGPVELFLAGREDLVESRHLVRVQGPRPVVTED